MAERYILDYRKPNGVRELLWLFEASLGAIGWTEARALAMAKMKPPAT